MFDAKAWTGGVFFCTASIESYGQGIPNSTSADREAKAGLLSPVIYNIINALSRYMFPLFPL